MRIGIFGGTFDPVHIGHLLLAEHCREQCGLDEVWFIPAGQPPHKQGQPQTEGSARADMLEFATAGIPQFQVNRMELKRTGPSYTVDTLTELKSEHPNDQLFFLIGADSLRDLPDWHRPDEILKLANIIAVNRGGQPAPDTSNVEAALGEEALQRIQIVNMPAMGVSSSDIRRRVSEKRSIRFMLPRAVEVYISEHELFRD